jgi:arabinogalactan oligomer/maltooligosaccharide transport system permease protein
VSTRVKLTAFFIAAIIASLALFLRVRAVNLLPIDYDEDDYLRAGQQIAQAIQFSKFTEILELNYRPEHPQLQKIFYGLVMSTLPGVSEIPDRPTTSPPANSLPQPHLYRARISSALINVFLVFGLALVNPLAGFVLAIHTYTIKYTSQVMLESLPMLMSFLAVFFYSRSSKKINGWLVLSGIALGLTVASKYIYGLVAIAILVDMLQHQMRLGSTSRAGTFKFILLLGFVAVVAFVLFDPYLWPQPVQRLINSVTFHGGYAQSEAVQQANLPFWQPFVWLFSSVPWHPGVFLVSIDMLITIVAVIGFPRMYRSHRVYAWWFLIAIGFLLFWPTKWAQYILVLIVPVSLSSGLGIQDFFSFIGSGIQGIGNRKGHARGNWSREITRTIPWLAPGLLVLLIIGVYPLVFQAGMALTDFTSAAIRDGLNGGVLREVWLGITGQVEPVDVRFFSFNPSRQVSYAGPNLLLSILFSYEGASLLVFELIWSLSSVSLQLGLGIAAALTVNRFSSKIKTILIALLILPWAIPEFVGALMWLQIFDPRFGWFILAQSNFTQRIDLPFLINPVVQSWQNDPGLALVYMLVPAVWYGFPLMMLAATAGLKLIPREVYEAALIDGATPWQKFSGITWPLLLPLMLPAIMIRMIFAFNQFYLFLIFQSPFPATTFVTSSYSFFADGGAYALSAGLNIVAITFLVVGILIFNRWTHASSGVTYAS